MNTEGFIAEKGAPVKRPYEKPMVQRVELALDETLGAGCKLGSDSACVGPPITAFNGGS
jgi:hypothetical protein